MSTSHVATPVTGGPAVPAGNPDVAVVIATHNRPELLRSAIKAVITQTYPGSIEAVVVFDRSRPDRTLELSEPGRVVRVITNTRSPGLAGARNTGCLSTDAAYLAFCDDDDEWLPDKLTHQIAALRDAPARTCVTGIIVDYQGSRTPRVPRAADFTLATVMRNRTMEAHPSTVLVHRQSLLDEIGLIDENIPGSYGEDFDWMLRALQAGPVRVVEEPLVTVRWGQSLFSQKWQVISDAIDYVLDKHDVLHRDPRAVARLYGRRAFANAALGNRAEALRTAWRTIRLSPAERRTYLAVAVALRLVSAERLMRLAHRRGHGI